MATPQLTDLQYAYFRCELPLETIASRTGSTPTKLMEELVATPLPPWLVASAKRLLTREGSISEAYMSRLHAP